MIKRIVTSIPTSYVATDEDKANLASIAGNLNSAKVNNIIDMNQQKESAAVKSKTDEDVNEESFSHGMH